MRLPVDSSCPVVVGERLTCMQWFMIRTNKQTNATKKEGLESCEESLRAHGGVGILFCKLSFFHISKKHTESPEDTD